MNCFTQHRGSLNIVVGPMFSGKSTWLNGVITELADTGFKVLKIIHIKDVRDDVASNDKKGTTHNSSYRSLSDKIDVISTDVLSSVNVNDYDVIGIDESQFFPDLLEYVEQWVEDKGKHVRVSGLCGDSSKKKYGQTLDLIPFCDKVKKLHARCHTCLVELKKMDYKGNIMSLEAPFTKCLVTKTSQTLVGGSDSYIPVCRYHHSC